MFVPISSARRAHFLSTGKRGIRGKEEVMAAERVMPKAKSNNVHARRLGRFGAKLLLDSFCPGCLDAVCLWYKAPLPSIQHPFFGVK